MRQYPHLFAKLFASPLMLHTPARQAFETALLARMRGDVSPHQEAIGSAGRVSADWLEWERMKKATEPLVRQEMIYTRHGNVALIKLHGAIDKSLTMMEMQCYGAVDLDDVDSALSLAAGDKRVDTIVLDMNSPGGSTVGVKETAQRIAQLTKEKEVHAYISGMCCSAAYYLASQTDLIAAGESAIVGSVGVYIALLDASRWYTDEGLNMQVLKAGEMKTMGADWRPITEQERAHLQGSVDRCYAEFRQAVTAHREVAQSTMEGQWMDCGTGHELKLVDALTTATLDDYVGDLIC